MGPRNNIHLMWARWCVIAFVLLTPLSIPLGPDAVNVQWSDLAAVGFLVAMIGSGGWRFGQIPRAVGIAMACYVGCSLPSLWQTHHLSGSILELTKTVYVVALGLALTQWASRPGEWFVLAKASALAVGAMLALSLGAWIYAVWSGHVASSVLIAMAVPNVGQILRVKGTLFTPTLLANYITMGLPLLAGVLAAHTRWPRATSWTTLLVGVLVAVATASHSLAGCLLAAALVAPRQHRVERMARRGLAALAAATMVAAWVMTTISVYQFQTTRQPAASPPVASAPHDFLGPQGTGEELTVRIHYGWVWYGLAKRFAWEAWQRHPWIGIGVGEFPHVVVQAAHAGRIHALYAGGADPHSTWYGTLAETGGIGLLGLLGFWIVLLRLGVSAQRRLAGSGEAWRVQAPLAGLAGLLVNSVHVDVMHFRFLWVGVALLLAARRGR